MTDFELLELAAKATGLIQSTPGWQHKDLTVLARDGGWRRWNPLKYGDDALALAVACRIGTDCYVDGEGKEHCCAWINHRNVSSFYREYIPYGEDAEAATRMAIVLVAAKLGEVME